MDFDIRALHPDVIAGDSSGSRRAQHLACGHVKYGPVPGTGNLSSKHCPSLLNVAGAAHDLATVILNTADTANLRGMLPQKHRVPASAKEFCRV
jgi:hypothetical protein